MSELLNIFNGAVMQLAQCKSNKEFIVFGDFNARNTTWNCTSNNTAENVLFDIQNHRNFYVHHSNSPTHYPYSGATPSTIDIMLSNSTIHFSPLTSHTNELSLDHAPIVCIIDADIDTKNAAQMFQYKKADWILYQIYVNERINLDTDLSNNDDIDKLLDQLTRTIHEARERALQL